MQRPKGTVQTRNKEREVRTEENLICIIAEIFLSKSALFIPKCLPVLSVSVIPILEKFSY